ncbi:MAG: phosphoribosylglycinamide formyltransferase [Paludibacteraceae bacterium]|nr:phosphoribosylglycinamide formyltransferase [Paludibacteraceae bacterium]
MNTASTLPPAADSHCVSIAVFASGDGSNCERLIRHFMSSSAARVGVVLSNRPDAYALVRAERLGVPTEVVTRDRLADPAVMLGLLDRYGVRFIVLAGFLALIPDFLVRAYERRIVNLHPSLLPKYGGRGMYGHHVHQAVKAAGERQTGITIHYVSARYDEGQVIAQYATALEPSDSVSDIERKVRRLEEQYLPSVVEALVRSLPF